MHGVVGSVLLAYPQNNYEERVFWIDPTMARLKPPLLDFTTLNVKNKEAVMTYISEPVTVVTVLNHKDGSRQTSIVLNKGHTYWLDQSDTSNPSHPSRF